MDVVAEISVLIRSEVMSLGDNLDDCAISVSVRVRSTNVSRPSVDERSSRSRCGGTDVCVDSAADPFDI